MHTYLSAKQIVDSEKYPFTTGQMRHYLMNRQKNGLLTSVRKIGKRLYVREDLFQIWVDSFEEVTND